MPKKEFLSFFPGSVIQFFDDTKENNKLAETIPCFDETKIKEKQKLGCGAFFSVNGFENGKRTKENLCRFNAAYIDYDVAKATDKIDNKTLSTLKEGAFQKIINGPLAPHFVIETRHGLQCLWLLADGFDINDYARTEEVLIKHYDADPGAKDVCRVLRMPQTYHLKDPSNPFLCQLLLDNTETGLKEYTIEDFTSNYYFPSPTTTALPYKQPSTTPNNILAAKKLPIRWVIERCAEHQDIKISWQENSNGTLQIIENGKVTSGFINPDTNIAYSMSKKPRKGDSVAIAQYYLCTIGDRKVKASQIADWLLYLADNNK